MEDVIVNGSRLRVRWAANARGRMFGKEFFEGELSEKEKARVLAMIRQFSQTGVIKSKEHFRALGQGLFEFKRGQIRFLGAYGPRGKEFSIASGLRKKTDRHKTKDLDKAKNILAEDQENIEKMSQRKERS